MDIDLNDPLTALWVGTFLFTLIIVMLCIGAAWLISLPMKFDKIPTTRERIERGWAIMDTYVLWVGLVLMLALVIWAFARDFTLAR